MMMRSIFSFSIAMILLNAGLLLAASSTLGQTQAGSPLAGQNGALNKNSMSPYMKPDGPMAPENNLPFKEQHVSDTIRENMAMEIQFSQLALKRSKSAAIKKFARQVIAENRELANEAKQFAPDKTGVFPNAMYEGTRQAVNAHAAEKQMKSLRGLAFDKVYLDEMNSYIENDQQVGHATYAMMEVPGASPVGRKMWDMANDRVKQIATLATKEHIKGEEGPTFP